MARSATIKRKTREDGRVDPAGVVFGAHTAYSLSELKTLAKDIRANGIDVKRFEKVLFRLDDLADAVTTVKHLEGGCKGRVDAGKCCRCHDVKEVREALIHVGHKHGQSERSAV